MKCDICRTELEFDHYYTFTKTTWLANDVIYAYENICDITIKVCDDCEKDLMRLYGELRADIADHIY